MSQQRQVRIKRQRSGHRKKAPSEKHARKRQCDDEPDLGTSSDRCSNGSENKYLRMMLATSAGNDKLQSCDYLRKLSLEILCKILSYLPLKDVVRLARLSRRMNEAITMHLRLLRDVDFTEGEVYGWMCTGFTDTTFASFLRRCPEVVNIYGLHMRNISKRRHRGSEQLSIPGIISALSSCSNLYGIETSDIFLLEAITNYLPTVNILSHFKNRNGSFPILQKNRFDLHRNPRITTLNLVGVVIPELPRMDFLKSLHLKWVKLTDPHPFKDFGVPLLQTFVMNNCAGPANALKYVPLITGLAGARSLKRMELVRVPFLGGLVQHVVEDSWRMQGFRQLKKVVFGTCKHALEVDLGYLVITCATRLEELSVQPSLTKDSFFASLTLADVSFPQFEALHLGFVDDFPEHGSLTNEQLVRYGLADANESPAMITDIGMKAVGQVFTNVKTLSIYNCPHLLYPTAWFTQGGQSWHRLKELHLRRCHALRLEDFCRVIPQLTSLESLCLEQMFREPPKGCSRVGLSAGTGLGVSSALVQNSANDLPNQGQGNNAPVVPANIPVNDAAVGAHPQDLSDNDGDLLDSDSDTEPGMDALRQPTTDSDSNANRHSISFTTSKKDSASDENSPNMDSDGRPSSENSADGRPSPACCCNTSNLQSVPSTSKGAHTDQSREACFCRETEDGRSRLKRTRQVDSGVNVSTSYREASEGLNDDAHSDMSPTRRSKRVTKYRDNSDGTTPSQHKSPAYKGKGKSLRGRKKGLVKGTRQGESHISNRNQSCQAVSEEIRETTKKAKDSDMKCSVDLPTKKNCRTDGSVNASCPVHSKPSATTVEPCDSEEQSAKPMKNISSFEDRRTCTRATQTDSLNGNSARNTENYRLLKPNMCDQSTSTSDPVIEEDHIQVLKIQSATLLHLTIRQVGVTNLTITDCPKMQLLVGSACRVIKKVCIKNAPQLTRINFSQCNKLDHEWLVDQVCQEPPDTNRLVILRPMQSYDPVSLQKQLFKSASYDYHMCLIHDYSADPELTLYNRMRASIILDVMASLHYELLTTSEFQRASRKQQFEENYPWGRNIYTLRGQSEGSDWWELVTDLPWLRSLSSQSKLLPDSLQTERDNRAGIYQIQGSSKIETSLQLLEADIAEAKESGLELYPQSTLVYVNTCDLNGPPVKDMYL